MVLRQCSVKIVFQLAPLVATQFRVDQVFALNAETDARLFQDR